jgi:hypothetical protein
MTYKRTVLVILIPVVVALLVMLVAVVPHAKSGTVNLVTVSCDNNVLIIASPNNSTTISCVVTWNLDPLVGYTQLAAVIFFPSPNGLTGASVIPTSAVYGISNYSGATPCNRTSQIYGGQIFTNFCGVVYQTLGAPLINGSVSRPFTFQIPRPGAAPGSYSGSIAAQVLAWQ